MRRTLLILSLLVITGVASAAPYASIVGSPTRVTGGWEYQYAIFNDLGPGGPAVLDFLLGNLDDVTFVTVPAAWDALSSGGLNGDVLWFDPNSVGLPPAQNIGDPPTSLTGFASRSPWGPRTDWATYSLTDENATEYTGRVTGPSIPEPATSALWLSGLAALYLYRRRRTPA